MTVRDQLAAARENAQEIENELEKANETVEILSNQLEEIADYVETEVVRIIEMLEGAHKHRDIDDAVADLKKLVEAI